MNNIHPLQAGTRVISKVPTCPCKGTKWKLVEGIIKRVKQSQRGGVRYFVYILNNGHRIREDWINEVL